MMRRACNWIRGDGVSMGPGPGIHGCCQDQWDLYTVRVLCPRLSNVNQGTEKETYTHTHTISIHTHTLTHTVWHNVHALNAHGRMLVYMAIVHVCGDMCMEITCFNLKLHVVFIVPFIFLSCLADVDIQRRMIAESTECLSITRVNEERK